GIVVVGVEPGLLGYVLPDQPVVVLHRAFLPAAVGSAEVAPASQLAADLLVEGELEAVVVGDAQDLAAGEHARARGGDLRAGLAGELREQRDAALALEEADEVAAAAGSLHQVGLPVAVGAAGADAGGAPGDVDPPGDPGARGLAAAPVSPPAVDAEVAVQLASGGLVRVDQPVDRLPAAKAGAAGDLLGAELGGEQRDDLHLGGEVQGGTARGLGGLPPPGHRLRLARTVAAQAAVARELAADRRLAEADRGRDGALADSFFTHAVDDATILLAEAPVAVFRHWSVLQTQRWSAARLSALRLCAGCGNPPCY